jgi:hypothetical protein
MTATTNSALPSNEAPEEVAIRDYKVIENRIRDLQEAARAAKGRCSSLLRQRLLVGCQLLYLSIAQFFRETIAPLLGWRWAVVLIGATIVGALFFALFLSVVAGMFGIVFGGILFASFVNLPSDSRLAVAVPTLKGLFADLALRQDEERNNLTGIEAEISVAKDKQCQLASRIEQYRQSRLCRLRELALRNWKAMRGGELECFLEEVFSELQYSVERTGKSGDQGVDLICVKDGHRIAVQVKGYLDSVPNTAIQEAFTGMVFYKCDACAVITNSRFTSSGKNVADVVGCALIDENTLPMLIIGQIDLLHEALAARTQKPPGIKGEAGREGH